MTFEITVESNELIIDFSPPSLEVEMALLGVQGNKGDKGDKGDTGALQNNIVGAYIGAALAEQPQFKEASLYVGLRHQAYARGDRSGLTAVDTFANLFDFTRATAGYATPASGVLTEYAVDVPRFEHDPLTGARKGLLIEPAQTNWLTYSAFDGADPTGWTTPFDTGTFTRTFEASGLFGLPTITQDQTDAGRSHLLKPLTLNASTQYTMSVAIDQDVSFYSSGVSIVALTLNFTGLTGDNAIELPDVVDNFAAATFTTSTDNTGDFRLGFGTVGDAAGKLRFAAPQLVTGPYAGSYIPTGATTATRAADLLEIKPAVVADVVSATEWTVFVEFEPLSPSEVARVWTLYNADEDNRITLFTLSNTYRLTVEVGGVVTLNNLNIGSIPAGSSRVSVGFNGSEITASINGGTVVNATTTAPASFSNLAIGATATGDANIAALLKTVAIFPRALSNAELQAITS